VVIEPRPPDLTSTDAIRSIHESYVHTRIILLSDENGRLGGQEALDRGIWASVYQRDGPEELIAVIQQAATGAIQWNASPGKSAHSSHVRTLSPRETQVLELMARGDSSTAVAAALGISTKTIEVHRANLMNKLGLHDIASLVRYAIRTGMIDP
jgi:DNA-binding NarL/FixJ family response regulator